MNRLLLVSNRLPLTLEKRKNRYTLKPSMGGLATGLSSFYKQFDSRWIGWAGLPSNQIDAAHWQEIQHELHVQHQSRPVPLSRKEIKDFYAGFCNRTLWPLFHYFPQLAVFDRDTWQTYVRVNTLFAEAVVDEARPGDLIWIHDYQLLLLPKMIRDRLPDAQLGFFLHIPFPSFELIRMLPWREALLEGMLGADLIGFHTHGYLRHFDSAVRHILGYEQNLGQIILGQRMARVDVFPMGIDYARFAETEPQPHLNWTALAQNRSGTPYRLILSVDRLDYTKGIPLRLKAFDRFLEKYPQYRDSVTLVLVAVPSRTSVESYKALKRQVDELVGYINGKYSLPGWTPIRYYYRGLPFDELVSLYALADVALLTPLRDGMNLVAKEYLATRSDDLGVLILSEMAGAANELGEALHINPQNEDQIAESLHQALSMPQEEQRRRNRLMKERLRRYPVTAWAQDFIDRLRQVRKDQDELQAKQITRGNRATLIHHYRHAPSRLLFLDYDGTLTPFKPRPQEAVPDDSLLAILDALARDERNTVFIISGRDRETLHRWFGHLPLHLSAEHGVWLKTPEGEWQMLENAHDQWKKDLRPLLLRFVDRTPGALIEEKPFSLAWHYRGASREMGGMRARELKEALRHLTANLNLQILEGSKVIEVKNLHIHKGRAVEYWTRDKQWDFVLAIGDDHTDESIFHELPENGYAIKVGLGLTKAGYFLCDVDEVRDLLSALIHAPSD